MFVSKVNKPNLLRIQNKAVITMKTQ